MQRVRALAEKTAREDAPSSMRSVQAAVFDGAEAGSEPETLLAGARESTQVQAARILASRKAGTSVKAVLANKDTKTITEYHGVPDRVRRLETKDRVYRHYVQREEDLETILRTGNLKVGRTSYVEFIGTSRAYIKNVFVDLQGVFFTQRDISSEEPLVMNMKVDHYIDFRVPEGVAALDMDNGRVLMIPGDFDPATYIPVEIVASSRD